jgi:hypothetical protein
VRQTRVEAVFVEQSGHRRRQSRVALHSAPCRGYGSPLAWMVRKGHAVAGKLRCWRLGTIRVDKAAVYANRFATAGLFVYDLRTAQVMRRASTCRNREILGPPAFGVNMAFVTPPRVCCPFGPGRNVVENRVRTARQPAAVFRQSGNGYFLDESFPVNLDRGGP